MAATVLVVVVLVAAAQVKAEIPKDGRCIWYGSGPQNPDRPWGSYLYDAYAGPGKVLEDSSAIRMLDEHCPVLMEELREEFGESVPLCCDAGNINDMTRQFGMLNTFIESCPACQTNLHMNLCYLTCHPRHSNFLIPTKIYDYTDEEGVPRQAVWEADLLVTDYYTTTTYDSCKNVYFSDLSLPAMVILCGEAGYACDPYELFTYLGTTWTPVNTSYTWHDDPVLAHDAYTGEDRTMTPFLKTTTPCNTTDPSMHCLCMDCWESCTYPDIPTHPELPMVGSVDVITFTLIIVYCVLAIAIIVAACTCWGDTNGGCCCCDCTCHCSQDISASIEEGIQKAFTTYGTVVAENPAVFLVVGTCLVVGLTIGVTYLQVATDPVELWASPTSETIQHKNYFDSRFNPFYRTTRLVITPKGYQWENVTVTDSFGNERKYLFGPALNATFVQRVMKLQTQITSLEGDLEGRPVPLKEVCEQPMAPQHDDCLIESVTNYWQNDPENLDQSIEDGMYTQKIVECISNPNSVLDQYCLASYGGPVLPNVALGGYPQEEEEEDEEDGLTPQPRYTESTALVITIHISNHLEEDRLQPALAWEKRFIEFMQEVTEDEGWTADMDIAFNAERGMEDELERVSQADMLTVLASYLIMFAYVAITLGNVIVKCDRLMIESKILLSLSGVTIAMLSVGASLGFYGYIGVPANLFVTKVLPFLVLAVGVDNIYILVVTWQQEPRKEGESVEEHVGRVVGKVASSMLLSALAELLCFFLGCLSDMPAVYNFALFAGFALLIDFLLQMTCFVALLALDAGRVEANRWEVFCCVRGSQRSNTQKETSVCYDFFDQFYAPFILSDFMRVVICLLFTGVAFAALATAPHVEVGLDQSLTVPEDSFVHKYFKYVNDYLSVGPPVYFVIKEGYNFTDIVEQNLVCQVDGCNDDSLLLQVFASSLIPDDTYIASGATSWLGTYFSWLSDNVASGGYMFACCRLDADGNFINSSAAFDFNAVETCLKPDDFVNGRPVPRLFMKHLKDFLSDNPHDTSCMSAGHPMYGQSVKVVRDTTNNEMVGATYYMAYHKTLKTSKDFIRALEFGYFLSDNMTDYMRSQTKFSPDIEVFPYSAFYIYHEQYLTMWQDAGISLSISVASVFLLTFLFTFDFTSTLIILATTGMIVADTMGLMVWWNVSLNAVSLVNLLMILGISVGFCCHLTHIFAISVKPTRLERAHEALATMGSSVFFGITLTKLAGIFMLGLAQTEIIPVFYFRMYVGMVLFGCTHALVFLPVFLSICGPPVNEALLNRKNKQEEVKMLRTQLKESQDENAALQTQLEAQKSLNHRQKQQTDAAGAVPQQMQHQQPCPPQQPIPTSSFQPQTQAQVPLPQPYPPQQPQYPSLPQFLNPPLQHQQLYPSQPSMYPSLPIVQTVSPQLHQQQPYSPQQPQHPSLPQSQAQHSLPQLQQPKEAVSPANITVPSVAHASDSPAEGIVDKGYQK